MPNGQALSDPPPARRGLAIRHSEIRAPALEHVRSSPSSRTANGLTPSNWRSGERVYWGRGALAALACTPLPNSQQTCLDSRFDPFGSLRDDKSKLGRDQSSRG